MTKIHCCLCSRRTDTNKQRCRIGSDAIWPLFCFHAKSAGLDINHFSHGDFVCMKCHSSIAHHGMNDRGPNKKVKVEKPFVFEVNIKKDVLRSFPKTIDADVASSLETSTDGGLNNIHFDKETGTVLSDIEDILPSTSGNHTNFDKESGTVIFDIEDILPSTSGNHTNFDKESGTVVYDIEDILPSTSGNHTNQHISLNDELLTEDTYDFDSEEAMSTTVLDFSEMISGTEPKTSNQNQQLSEGTVANQNQQLAEESFEEESVHCQDQNISVVLNSTNSVHLQGVKATQSRCFICQSNGGRKAIPWTAIQHAWFEKLCYIPKLNRTCKEHLTTSNKFTAEALQLIEVVKQDVYVSNEEFELWLPAISKIAKSTPYNFEVDGVEAEKYKMFLGISKDNFDDLVQYLHGMRNTTTRSLRTALAMFLLLLRNNMKQEIIAFNFSTTQQVVSSTIDAVSSCLEEHFVSKHLGYYHITREEALQKHSIKLTSKVLGQSEDRLCLIADCTYNFIEKPSDFELQRKTYSLHKHRNLLKPLYIVFPSGYILEAAGPYFCDAKNNDAMNIRHHYKNSDLLLFLEEDDFFILDRGFRDVVKETTDNGHSVLMPALLGGKRTHFTCEEANESRKVTMNRWVIEAVNARIKNVFPFFKHMIEGSYVPKIMRFNRIACAVINCYFPPLFKDTDFHNIILEEATNLTSNINPLKEEIERLGIERMTTRWVKATALSVPDFPQLSMDDLKRLTLGSYQIRIAEKYIDHHMREDNQFGIFIHHENDGILRAKIQSRFSRSKTHNAWVKYDADDVGYSAIKGFYCTCKVGERSLGCCSHLASVIRYLGYDRHQAPKVISRRPLPWDAIDCNEHCDELSDDECGDYLPDECDETLPSEDELIDFN